MLSTRVTDAEDAAARSCGLDRATLRYLRSLLDERGRASWAIGDVLVAAFGPPGPAIVHDGSSERLARLADTLGCSWQWLAACRATSAAWPERERRITVAWAVSRALVARPDRIRLLHAFVERCERQRVTPSLARLTDWLDERETASRRTGRPRLDPVVRIERMALQLDRDALACLVERLTAVLATPAAA